jgi:diaminohydroxyphosphoribosylaminopyrimidine deaminase / 5-amino-6-(5-phosphoribosylamino)uracil reductase
VTRTEHEAMRRAIDLALRGWGRVAPNPMVGAVLLRDGEIVGEGWHAEFGGPHAETMALAACDDATGTTCVVSLEPCAHHGKTPPCVDALIAAGVARVVVAVRDPTTEAGGGLEKLQAAGVGVAVGEMADDAAAVNAGFLCGALRPDRPWVAVKLATTLDGFIADASGASQWITGPDARDWVHWLRAGFDAIAVGRATALKDDPALTARGTVTPRVPPARIVFAGTGDVPVTLRCFTRDVGGPAIAVVHPDVQADREGTLASAGVDVLAASTPAKALRRLRARGIRTLLVEGGGRLVGALLDANLVDRVYRVTAPRWLGLGTPAWTARTSVRLADAAAWAVTERRTLGGDTLLVVDRDPCLPES